MRTVAVIGAGPAGLAAAYELLRCSKEYRVTVFEKAAVVGGLSKTLEFEGGRVDIGGHRFFSKSESVLSLWEEVLPFDDQGMLMRSRESHILWDSKLISYPIQLDVATMGAMGLVRGSKAVASYLQAKLRKGKIATLEDFYVDRFGRELYTLFFEDYTRKLWGLPASKLSPDWGSQRVRKVSLGALLRSALWHPEYDDGNRSLVNSYRYPAFGSGQMWEALRDKVVALGGEVKTSCLVEGMGYDGRRIEFVEYCERGHPAKSQFDFVVSSMPLGDLPVVVRDIPPEVGKACARLRYRDMVIVAVDFLKDAMGTTFQKAQRDSWLYAQDNRLRVGRWQILNNWSPFLVRNSGHVLLEAEYFCDEEDSLWSMDDAALANLALAELIRCGMCRDSAMADSYLVSRIEKAYPTYDDAYRRLPIIARWVDGVSNLLCVGRNGLHRYNNMDHSVESGLRAARIIMGSERDKGSLWDVGGGRDYLEEQESLR